jgi:hypothetical protein
MSYRRPRRRSMFHALHPPVLKLKGRKGLEAAFYCPCCDHRLVIDAPGQPAFFDGYIECPKCRVYLQVYSDGERVLQNLQRAGRTLWRSAPEAAKRLDVGAMTWVLDLINNCECDDCIMGRALVYVKIETHARYHGLLAPPRETARPED